MNTKKPFHYSWKFQGWKKWWGQSDWPKYWHMSAHNRMCEQPACDLTFHRLPAQHGVGPQGSHFSVATKPLWFSLDLRVITQRKMQWDVYCWFMVCWRLSCIPGGPFIIINLFYRYCKKAPPYYIMVLGLWRERQISVVCSLGKRRLFIHQQWLFCDIFLLFSAGEAFVWPAAAAVYPQETGYTGQIQCTSAENSWLFQIISLQLHAFWGEGVPHSLGTGSEAPISAILMFNCFPYYKTLRWMNFSLTPIDKFRTEHQTWLVQTIE